MDCSGFYGNFFPCGGRQYPSGLTVFIHMTLSCWLALLVTFPYLVYEIWRFVCPALYEREKRGVGAAFLFGTLMFFLGCFVGYGLVFPMTLRFLYTYELSPSITNQLSLDSYMDNFLTLIFLMGIIFELPLLSALLSKLGILNRSFFINTGDMQSWFC